MFLRAQPYTLSVVLFAELVHLKFAYGGKETIGDGYTIVILISSLLPCSHLDAHIDCDPYGEGR